MLGSTESLCTTHTNRPQIYYIYIRVHVENEARDESSVQVEIPDARCQIARRQARGPSGLLYCRLTG